MLKSQNKQPQQNTLEIPASARMGRTDPEAWKAKAKGLVYSARHEEAIKIANSLIADNPRDTDAAALIIRASALAGKFEDSKRLLSRYLRDGLADSSIYGAFVFACAAMDKEGQFRSYLGVMVTKSYLDEHSAISMLVWMGKAGLTNYARKVFDVAVSLGLDDPDIYTSMFLAYADSFDSSNAERMFWSAAGKMCPGTALFQEMVRCFEKKGDIRSARKYFNTALCLGRIDERLCSTMLKVYLEAGLVDEAAGFVRSLSEKSVYTLQLSQGLISALIEAGRVQDAKTVFDFAAEKGRISCTMIYDIVKSLMDANDPGSAHDAIIKAAQKGVLSIKSLEIVTSAYYDAGRFGRIIEIIDSLPKEDQMRPYVALRKAEALRKVKRWDEAISQVRSALERNEMNEDERNLAFTILAYSLKDNGHPQKAMEMLIDLLDTIPPGSCRLARVLCGIVFAWQNTGFLIPMENDTRQGLIRRLRSFDLDSRTNLPRDVEMAISLLERYRPAPDRR